MLARKNDYISKIIEYHHNWVANPETILYNMLVAYAEDADNLVSLGLFNQKRKSDNHIFVHKLIKLKNYSSTDDYVLTVIRHLHVNLENFQFEYDFILLLRAFFSIYKMYHPYLTLKLQIQLDFENAIDDIWNETISSIFESKIHSDAKFHNILQDIKNMDWWMPSDNQRHAFATRMLTELHNWSDGKDRFSELIQLSRWIPSEMQIDFINILVTKINHPQCSRHASKLLGQLKDWIPIEMQDEIVNMLLILLEDDKLNLGSNVMFALCDLKDWVPVSRRDDIVDRLIASISDQSVYTSSEVSLILNEIKEWVPPLRRVNIINQLFTNMSSTTLDSMINNRTVRVKAYYFFKELKEWIPEDMHKQFATLLLEQVCSGEMDDDERQVIGAALGSLAKVASLELTAFIHGVFIGMYVVGMEGSHQCLSEMKGVLPMETSIEKTTQMISFLDMVVLDDETQNGINQGKLISYKLLTMWVVDEWLLPAIRISLVKLVICRDDFPNHIKDALLVSICKIPDDSLIEMRARLITRLFNDIKSNEDQFERFSSINKLSELGAWLTADQQRLLVESMMLYLADKNTTKIQQISYHLQQIFVLHVTKHMSIDNIVMLLSQLRAMADDSELVVNVVIPLNQFLQNEYSVEYLKRKAAKDCDLDIPPEIIQSAKRYL